MRSDGAQVVGRVARGAAVAALGGKDCLKLKLNIPAGYSE